MRRHPLLIYIVIVISCVGIAVLLEWLTTPPPVPRKIHIEAFRYGTSPSVIRVNRGDRLTLSFSTRDTAHSFFLQDYKIDAKIAPANDIVEIRNPLRPTQPASYAKAVHFIAGLPGFWGKLVSASRFRCHVYCGPMHGFEQGDLIVRPNWLLAGSMGILLAIFIVGYLRVKWGASLWEPKIGTFIDLNQRFAWLDKLLKWRPLQFTCTLPMVACFTIIVLAGFFGTKVGGRNLAVTLTWIVWISALAILFVPVGGRIWCMVCPVPVLGEYLQRGATIEVRAGKQGQFGNRFFGLQKRWPCALRGPWIRLSFLLGLGTISASLAGQPRWTAIALISMVAIAIFMSLIWELRSFCRYMCPIASFISVYSAVGHLMVQKRDAKTCRNCREKPCLTGNTKGWACPYGLTVARIDRNTDCGMCMECFKSCQNNNVSLAWRKGSWTLRHNSYGEAWEVIVLLILAMAYSFTVHSPWPVIRDMVNIVDKGSLSGFGLWTIVLWSVAFGFAPLLLWVACGLGLRFSGTDRLGDNRQREEYIYFFRRFFNASVGKVFKKTMPAFIPFGLALWAAFFTTTIMVNFTFVLLTFSDPFGWGWDLLGIAGMPWVQVWPSGIPWIQTVLVLIGATTSLKIGYAIWKSVVPIKGAALKGFVPTGIVLFMLAAIMVIYFTAY